MKLSYQIATNEVPIGPRVGGYQGPLEHTFSRLRECGYDGAELGVCNPRLVDVALIDKLQERYCLDIPMVCTGEVFGTDGLCFSETDSEKRNEAIRRATEAIDLAAHYGANINIGRLRGGLLWGKPEELCRRNSVEALKYIADYAGKKNVTVALEPINCISINFINTTQEGLALIREIDNPALKLMLDTNHMHISDKDMMRSFEEAKGEFVFIHATDSNRLYPGNCKIDFEQVIRKLHEVGYDGWISVEAYQRPSQDYALEKSFAYLHPLIEAINKIK